MFVVCMENSTQYCGEIPSVLRRNTINTVEDTQCCGGLHLYCGGYLVLSGDTISIVRGLHLYCGWCLELLGISLVLLRDTRSIVEGYNQCFGGRTQKL